MLELIVCGLCLPDLHNHCVFYVLKVHDAFGKMRKVDPSDPMKNSSLTFLDLAVAKSLQSTRTVTDDDDADDDADADVLTSTGYTC